MLIKITKHVNEKFQTNVKVEIEEFMFDSERPYAERRTDYQDNTRMTEQYKVITKPAQLEDDIMAHWFDTFEEYAIFLHDCLVILKESSANTLKQEMEEYE